MSQNSHLELELVTGQSPAMPIRTKRIIFIFDAISAFMGESLQKGIAFRAHGVKPNEKMMPMKVPTGPGRTIGTVDKAVPCHGD
jgi:hypothetical protein